MPVLPTAMLLSYVACSTSCVCDCMLSVPVLSHNAVKEAVVSVCGGAWTLSGCALVQSMPHSGVE
jgi:hypothetical protein